MTDKQLFEKLNNLKNVNPEAGWQASNRELLLAQISNSGASSLSNWQAFVINFQSFAKAASQPAFALASFIVVLLSVGVFSHQVFSQAKPNDSMYIARIISEKAKLSVTLDAKSRDKMAVQFATNHAQDISAVLADPEFNNEANQDQVAKLNDSFKREIETARTRISYLNQVEAPASQTEAVVSIANDDKDGQGIQVSVSSDSAQATEVKPADPVLPAETVSIEAASSTETASSTEASAAEAEGETAPAKILEEAQELFNNKDYSSAADKLEEVDQMLNK